METTPNTLDYLIGGYVVFSLVMALYLLSLALRWKNLQKEEQALEELETGG
jgi:hypothetical protein